MNQKLSKNKEDVNRNFVSPEAQEAYRQSLLRHIMLVQEAGSLLGVPKSQLDEHDNSKWGKEEFWDYAQHFHGTKADPTGFSLAWNHHVHNNPHHWQYWIHPAGGVVQGCDLFNDAFVMPKNFALEMVADWLGASKGYTGSWDMTEWLGKSWLRMKIHSETRKFLYDVLREIYNGKAWEL